MRVLTTVLAGWLALMLWAAPADAHRYCNNVQETAINDACLANAGIEFTEDFEDGSWAESNCDFNGGRSNPANDGWCMTIFYWNAGYTLTDGTNGVGFNPPVVSGYVAQGINGSTYSGTSGVKEGCEVASPISSGATTIDCVDASTLPTASSAFCKDSQGNSLWLTQAWPQYHSWTGKSGNQLTGVSGITENLDADRIVGCEGSAMMGDHEFQNGVVSEFFVRQYMYTGTTYVPGHEKVTVPMVSGLPTLWITYISSGTDAVYAGLEYLHQSAFRYANLVTPDIVIQKNHVYAMEEHFKINTPGVADGIYELWMEDCGVGITATCSGTFTKRSSYTDLFYRDGAGEAAYNFSAVWFENWANAPSMGERRIDNIVVANPSYCPGRAASDPCIGLVGVAAPPTSPGRFNPALNLRVAEAP